MNRLQNSIVRFLKYVIELENLIILLNIGSLSLHSRQVPSIDFLMEERVWRPCITGSH